MATKQELFEQVQEAVREYNDELASYQDEVQSLAELNEPNDFDDVEGLESEILSSWDLPSTDGIESASSRLNQAIEEFEEAVELYDVTAVFRVEADDEHAAMLKLEDSLSRSGLQFGAGIDFSRIEDADPAEA